MKNLLEISHVIMSSECDMVSRLKLAKIADIFQDVAFVHSRELGFDHASMLERYNAFWIVPRMKFSFHRLPMLSENLTVRTWPNSPKAVRGNRNYQMLSGSEVIIEGRAEWSMLDADSRSIMRLDKTDYISSIVFHNEICCPEPFLPLGDALDESCFVYSHRVGYSDIDMSDHVNNAVYIRLLIDAIPAPLLRRIQSGEFEIRYMHECRLGDTISFYANQSEAGWQLYGKRADGVTAVFALLKAEAHV